MGRRRILQTAVFVFLAHPDTTLAQEPDSGRVPQTLPAYAHNDYENARPLVDALELGYRGVEADYYVVDGVLLVGHDRGDLRPERTLEALYLQPLRKRVRTCGTVYSDGAVFTLNIESKEAGAHTYEALHALLSSYAEMLTAVRNGHEQRGAVQVVLVGWHPPLEDLVRQQVRFVAVQQYFADLSQDQATYPSHLVRMISVEYKSEFSWRGGAHVPHQFDQRLRAIIEARDAVDGRVVRVFRAPRSRSVYRALLAGGVDLIGTKTIRETQEILTELARESRHGSAGRVGPEWGNPRRKRAR